MGRERKGKERKGKGREKRNWEEEWTGQDIENE